MSFKDAGDVTMVPCVEGGMEAFGKKWDFGRELNEWEAGSKAGNMGQQRAGGSPRPGHWRTATLAQSVSHRRSGTRAPAPIWGPGRGHVGRETLKPPGSGTCLRGRASVPTHSVWSLGRHWNADLPTDWMGLS